MSQTFSLVCHESRQKIWIGQGWGSMTSFYSGAPDTMQALQEFFKATMGKPLLLVCDDTAEDSLFEYDEFEHADGATYIIRHDENGSPHRIPLQAAT